MITKQCAILIGGMGTRLGALTQETPKPLLPVAGEPFLEILVGEASRRGFNDILLLAGYKAAVVEEFAAALGSKIPADFRVRVSIEAAPLGTGGAVAHAADSLEDQFLLLNGDTWFDFNWLDLFSVANGGCAVAARFVPDADRHETLAISETGAVTRIVPRATNSGSGLVNGGVYVLRKAELNGFGESFSIEADLLPRLTARSQLRAREYDGYFLDIGVPETFKTAQSEIPAQRRRPAIFFDRDGVLNHDDNYVGSVEKLRWISGAKAAVRLANDCGYYVFVVTNQAGVARGYYGEDAVRSLHSSMADELRGVGAYVDDWRYCPYHPQGSVERYRRSHPWRKPEPGMILDLMQRWPVDPAGSMLIGDKESDCAAAEAAGIEPVLFKGGDLYEFVADLIAAKSTDGRGIPE